MKKHDFERSLPSVTVCESCGGVLTRVEWIVRQFGVEWYALGISKCEDCSLVRVAAAGSTELAQQFASQARSDLMKSIR